MAYCKEMNRQLCPVKDGGLVTTEPPGVGAGGPGPRGRRHTTEARRTFRNEQEVHHRSGPLSLPSAGPRGEVRAGVEGFM
jgi:hypothetical protein